MTNILNHNKWDVIYCGIATMVKFTAKQQFKLAPLTTYPFLFNSTAFTKYYPLKKWKYKVLRKWSERPFTDRYNELKSLLNKYNPDIVFIDPFYYSDFIVIKALKPAIRCIFLDVRFPSQRNSKNIPPSNVYAFPGKVAKRLWIKYQIGQFFSDLVKRTIYFSRDDLSSLKTRFKSLNISVQHTVYTNKLFGPAFKNIETWYLFPQQMDFPGQQLFPWQKYVPLGISTDRFERITGQLRAFIQQKESINTSKLIYCSMGGLSDVHTNRGKNKEQLRIFFQNLINLATKLPHYFLIIAIEQKTQATLTEVPSNVYMADFIPQVFVLKQADLMINHGGGSINEAAYFGVPMLVCPINNFWDFNGNAARVVYHGLGLKSSFAASAHQIEADITQLLSNIKFRESTKKMAARIKSDEINFNLETLIDVQ